MLSFLSLLQFLHPLNQSFSLKNYRRHHHRYNLHHRSRLGQLTGGLDFAFKLPSLVVEHALGFRLKLSQP